MSYWSDRQAKLYRQAERDEEALKQKLSNYYDREQRKLEKEIASFYRLYGEGDIIEYRKLMETLNDSDRRLLMEKMDAFALKYPEYSHLLPVRENIYKLNRLEGLEYSIRMQQLEIGAINQREVEKHLAKLATRSANASMEMMGFGRNFYTVNSDIIQALINQAWVEGANFSTDIWQNTDKLAGYLVNDAAVGFANGKPYAKMVSELCERFGKVTRRDAYRLIYTEGTFVMNEGAMVAFQDDFEYYKISTAQDGKVCKICLGVATSKEPFPIKDRMPGRNFPPFHPWCRCFFEIVVADWDAWAREYDKKHLEGGQEISKRLRNDEESGIINKKSGGSTGAKKTPGWEHRHAELMYEEIRHRSTDTGKISKNIGWTTSDVEIVKNHMFVAEHRFADGTTRRFDSDFEQAQAWDRLTHGNYTDVDILLLEHELEEAGLMEKGLVYEDAHERANQKYNWFKELMKGD